MSVLLLGIALSGCVQSAPPDHRPEVAAALAEHVGLAHYLALEAASAELSQQATALCAGPTDTALTATRDAWWAAREPLKRAEVIQFGPVIEYPDRLGPKLDDWPVNADAIEELVAGDDALDFDAMGTATRGSPVVEYLLWGQGDDTLDALSTDPRRCEVLAGACADLHANTSRLVEAWRTDWLGPLSDPAGAGPASPYSTLQDVIDEWVNRMGFTVENVRATKLGKPLGDDAGGTPQPDTLESRHSGRSLADARDALAGVRDVWDGAGGGQHPGISRLAEPDPQLSAQLDELFEASALRLSEIPEPLEESVALSPGRVADAQEALRALQVAIQVDLAPGLGVTITFNDNDGD